jgi:hypothetical protein
MMMLGQVWKANDEEKNSMVGAWDLYFQEKGSVTIPSWLMILVTSMSYASPRISEEKTRSRLMSIYGSIRSLTINSLKGVRLWLKKRVS